MENINNLRFLYITSNHSITDEFRITLYKSHFKGVDDVFHHVYNHIDNYDNITYLEYIDILNDNISIYTLDEFCCALNNDSVSLDFADIIPIFLDGQERKNTKDNEQQPIEDYITELDKVYSKCFDNISKLMKEHDNLVKVHDYYYKIDDNGCDLLISCNDGASFNKVEETHYGYCEIFNQIQKAIENEKKENKIIDTILNLSCDEMTQLMRKVGMWNKDEIVADINDMQKVFLNANQEGYDVTIHVEVGHDYFIHGNYNKTEKRYYIYGLAEESSEFMDLLQMDELVKIVSANPDYLRART